MAANNGSASILLMVAVLLGVMVNEAFQTPNTSVINNLLKTCTRDKIESCNICSLCQNGAFCSIKHSPAKSGYIKGGQAAVAGGKFLQIRNGNLLRQPANQEEALEYLRSLIDFTCYCVPGYTGTYCQLDIDECLSMPCSNNSTCENKINSFECHCPAGFTGEHCEININECASSPCMSGSECLDLIDGYYCKCLPGFTGRTCSIDIDECATKQCQHNSTCINLINKFECDCTNTGFRGKFCETNIDDCEHVKCQHNASCIDGVKSFKCDCFPGYEGQLCETDIDECSSSPCIHGKCWQNSDQNSFIRRIQLFNSSSSPIEIVWSTVGALEDTTATTATTNQPGDHTKSDMFDVSFNYNFGYDKAAGYWCECTPGYTGLNCETKVDECRLNPCGSNGKCLDMVNEFKCLCHPGFTGTKCEQNIDECELYSPCAESTRCHDLVPDYTSGLVEGKAGYECDCSELNERLFKANGNRHVSYTGQNCTLKLNACRKQKHMCLNNSTCISSLNRHSNEQEIQCVCEPGYAGVFCQYLTSVRLDGTYSLNASIQQHLEHTSTNVLKFDFKLKFFNKLEQHLPLVYMQTNENSLFFEITVNRDYLSIENAALGLNERLAFYYPYENADRIWHSIEITILSSKLQIVYAVKQLHLVEKKIINLKGSWASIKPDSFSIGRFYAAPHSLQKTFLNGACVRDVTFNNEYMFKIDQFSFKTPQVNSIKFGCEHVSNECGSTPAKVDFCEHNSTCVHRWFTHECAGCNLPFYGTNCHLEATKIGFFYSDSQLVLLNDSPASTDSSSHLEMFKISFYLSRINSRARSQDAIYFLKLKQSTGQSTKSNHFYYLLGINEYGYLSLLKIFVNSTAKVKQWSLTNEHVNLNMLTAVKISLKLSNKFIEINLNDKHMSRYELVSSSDQTKGFRVEEINFANTINNSDLFLLSNLKLMDLSYEFEATNSDKQSVKLNILNNVPIDIKMSAGLNTFKLFKQSKLKFYKVSTANGQIVDDLNARMCPIKSCFELNGAMSRMSVSSMIVTKNLTCNRNELTFNRCENYGTIHRSLFSLDESLDGKHSSIMYYFDFKPNHIDSIPHQPLLMNHDEMNNKKDYEFLLKMRDTEFDSFSFDMSLSQAANRSQESTEQHAETSNLFTLNTFDELSHNQIFLFGVNLIRRWAMNETSIFELELFTNQIASSKSTHLLTTDPGKLFNLNVTFTSKTMSLQLNGKHLIQLEDTHLIVRSLLKAYGSFMLNFTSESRTSLFPISACLSNLKLSTRNMLAPRTTGRNVYELVKQTKSIYLLNENAELSSQCKSQLIDSSLFENDEVSSSESSFLADNECYLIEKINIETNERLPDAYHCKCNTTNTCPYDFWSNLKEAETARPTRPKASGCAVAGDYACFNNGTCLDRPDMSSPTESDQLSYSCSCPQFYTGKRCETFDPCLDNPCSPDSVCLPVTNTANQMTYECKCNAGFLGRNCTINLSKTCLASPCLNGASCMNVTLINDPQTIGYSCICGIGYEGEHCERRRDFCRTYRPCMHGNCINNLDDSFYTCECANGWTGINCTQDIDECGGHSPETCSQQGACINLDGSFNCECDKPFYYGRTCQFKHACHNSTNPCRHGASCLPYGDLSDKKHTCQCLQGFTGPNCEYMTCDSMPCKHDSTCSMIDSTHFVCNCTGTGFTGPVCDMSEQECIEMACSKNNSTCDPTKCDCNLLNCEDSVYRRSRSKSRDPMYHLILWPLLIVMLALLGILFGTFVMKMKKSRATHGTYSPSRHEQQASRIEFNMDSKIPPEERLI